MRNFAVARLVRKDKDQVKTPQGRGTRFSLKGKRVRVDGKNPLAESKADRRQDPQGKSQKEAGSGKQS
jgi:hypothetical protein